MSYTTLQMMADSYGSSRIACCVRSSSLLFGCGADCCNGGWSAAILKQGDGKKEVVSVGVLSVDSVTGPRVTSDSHLSSWLNQSKSICFDRVFYFASVLFRRTGCPGHAITHHLIKQAGALMDHF